MRIFKRDLTHYFLREHDQLPPAYLASCQKFFKELSAKHQASSNKRQASHCGSLVSGLKIDLTERYNMNTQEALKIVGGLSKPSKMPGWAYGIPAAECKTGKKLQDVPGSTCEGCYATKGCYVFPVVQAAQYRRLEAIKSPLWVGAMALLINSKKSKWFRWHDSGDIQDVDHLLKIFAVCKLTPETRHWLPTREAWTKDFLDQVPGNLTLRFSMPMIDQPAAGSWVNTSTVVSGQGRTCPAPDQSNECKDCRACWDPSVRNVAYGKH
jgi:hypothetical protein